MPTTIDPRQISVGKNGQLFDLGDGAFMADVNTYHAQVAITNQTYRPAGSAQEVEVPDSYKVTLTFTETVVKDARLLQKLYAWLNGGPIPSFNFRGDVTRSDGSSEQQVFRDCVPSGTIDLQNIAPGQIVQRAWSFTVNSPPSLQSLL